MIRSWEALLLYNSTVISIERTPIFKNYRDGVLLANPKPILIHFVTKFWAFEEVDCNP